MRKNDKLTNDVVNQKLDNLEQEQEIFKATQAIKDSYKQKKFGGDIHISTNNRYNQYPIYGESMGKGGKLMWSGGDPRIEEYNQFGTNYMTPRTAQKFDVNTSNQDTPTTYAQAVEDNSGVGTYVPPVNNKVARVRNSNNNKQDMSPYLGAGLQAIGDLDYLAKYNKVQTVPNYQQIAQQDYVPQKLDSTQAIAGQDLETRTALKNVPTYSGNNSATALDNMLAVGAQGARQRAAIQQSYDQQNIGNANEAKQFNIRNNMNRNQFNRQMTQSYDVGHLQDLTQQQNAEVGHLSNIGAYGQQALVDSRGYKNQDTDRDMINQLYKNYYMKDGKLYNRATNKVING